MPTYEVIQKRWIRWNEEWNNEREIVVWTGTSIKAARGKVKELTHSVKENMEKHNWLDGQRFDKQRGLLQYWDDEGVWFEQTYTIRIKDE